MKCPACNSWTLVKETRTNKEGYRRRRECGNGHLFTTQELVIINPKGLKRSKTPELVFAEIHG